MNNLLTIYDNNIYQRYNDLLLSGKTIDELDNYDLAKIFESIMIIYIVLNLYY